MIYRALIVIVLAGFAVFAICSRSHAGPVYAHDRCNIDWLCEGVTTSARGEQVVRAMGGFGSARKVYKPVSPKPMIRFAPSNEAAKINAQTGNASFYGGKAHHGKPMANGQTFDQESDSCAHRSLPFGTHLRVSRAGGGAVVCVVRDRGPFIAGRIVDLSVRQARELRMIAAGVVAVRVTVE